KERILGVAMQMNERHEQRTITIGLSGRQRRTGAISFRLLRRLASALVVLIIVVLAITPMGCYVSRAAFEEGKILAHRKSIAKLVADTTTEPATRAKLMLVSQAREFARDSLGLKTGKSFTTYARLDRDTLVLVLSAAYKDRLERKTWWFPIVGRFPYKGFFDFNKAKKTATEMREQGFDVTLGASSAFSTLGWFNDPLVSTTLAADSITLVNTVIHELLHNTFFAKGSVPFNESFASFVGGRGAEAFFRSRGDTASLRRAQADWHDDVILGAFWAKLSTQIETAFAAFPIDSTDARIAAREKIYTAARKELVDSVAPLLQTYPPHWAERVTLNNAVLLSRRVYAQGLDQFDAVFAREGNDLKKAIARVSEIAKGKAAPDSAVLNWLHSEQR
ncbi:MAG: aminopeptidase, partial [Gemmatimonadaceae bacterium]